MKLQTKIILVVSMVIVGVAGAISLVFYNFISNSTEEHMAHGAMDMSSVIANEHEISERLYQKMRDGSIQEIVEEIRSKSRYQYIIVMDMDGIQYSYPYESGLYKHYKNGGEEKVLQGSDAYFLADTNRLISAIRVFQPIYYNNEQAGAVLIGLLSDEIQKEVDSEIQHLAGLVIGALVFGIAAAILLSLNIKKATFGLEPKEIAVLAGERDLILHSIERGIIAIDRNGKLLFRNRKASLLLDMPTDEDVTVKVSESAKAVYLIMKEGIDSEQGIENEKVILGNDRPLLISVCLMHDHSGKVTGAVANLENMTQVQALAEELTGYRALVDSLRAQNHEFMNRLMTISGLIQLGEKDEVLSYITDLSSRNSRLQHLLSEQIRDNKIAGLLLTKYAAFSEKKVNVYINDESSLTGLPAKLTTDEACSIIGNLLDNSMDAVQNSDDKRIDIFISADRDHFELEVYNSGPEIDEETAKGIFEKGFSTKGENRGYGLYMVKNLVEKAGGQIEQENDKGVRWHVDI